MTLAISSVVAMDPEQLYLQHAEALYRYALHYSGDADLASDIVQETFMRLVRRPPVETSPKAWLFQVATNLAREWSRTGARRDRLLHGGPLDAAHSDAPLAPDLQAIAREDHAIVQRALASLPERDRTLLLMREEGFTHAEIAAAVGTTTKSVGTLAARALTRLAARLTRIQDIR